jgi:hypothetical protein
MALERVQPALHVFGHIHESYGAAQLTTGTLAVDASTCDISYKACQPPVVVHMQLAGSPGRRRTAAAAAAEAATVGGVAGPASSRQKPTVVSVSRSWRQQ